jgi:hypothetical protein
MNWKKLFGCLIVTSCLAGFVGVVQADDDDEGRGRSCNPGGVWFVFPNGNPPFHLVSLIPIDGGKKRYIVDTEGQDPMQTPFRGEMARVKKNVYKFWGMKYFWKSPPGEYLYMVNSGYWRMTDCNSAELEVLQSFYSGDPFPDPDDAVYLGSYVRNNLFVRMPMIDDSSDF